MKKILNFSVCLILILALTVPSNLTALASSEIPPAESTMPADEIESEVPPELTQVPSTEEPADTPLIEVLPDESLEPEHPSPEASIVPELPEQSPQISESEPESEQQSPAPTEIPAIDMDTDADAPVPSQNPEEEAEEELPSADEEVMNALTVMLSEVQVMYEAEPNEAWLGALAADITLALEGNGASDELSLFQKRLDYYKVLTNLLTSAKDTLSVCQADENNDSLKQLSEGLNELIIDIETALTDGASFEDVDLLQARFMELMIMPLDNQERDADIEKMLKLLHNNSAYKGIENSKNRTWPEYTKEQFTKLIENEISLIPDELLKEAVKVFSGKNAFKKGEVLQKLLNITAEDKSAYTTKSDKAVNRLAGIWIENNKNSSDKIYTYCSQKDVRYPDAGIDYMLLDEDPTLDGYTDKLCRVLEAGYPLDLYGFSQLQPELSNYQKGYYTQVAIWTILADQKDESFGPYMGALYEYAMTGRVEGQDLEIRDKAVVSVQNEDLTDDGIIPLYEKLSEEDEQIYKDVIADYTYKAKIHLAADKDVEVTLNRLPETGKIYYNLYNNVKELKQGEKIGIENELLYVSAQPLASDNEIEFSYVSYKKVAEGSIKSLLSFDIQYISGWQIYQKMIGYQLEDVIGTLKIKAEGKKKTPSESPSPAPSESPSPSPEVTPSPTPEVTPSPTPEVSPSPSPEVTPSPTPEVSPSPSPEVTPSPTPEVSPSPSPEVTPSPAPTPTPSTQSNPTPSDPTMPVTPSAPPLDEEEIDIPDEEIPQAPVDVVEIYEEIPTGPIEEEEIDLDEEIPTGPVEEELDLDEEIPTGPGDILPQTGTVPATSFALLGGILIACGAFFVWKKEKS